jgi:two-component system cell cycle response regulator/two-component system cell cycle response regulator DivK
MKKIIVVDYDQSFHPYIRILLERLGYTVMPAKKGIDVIKLVQFEQPDAIILDVGRETADGLMTFAHIKMNAKTSTIPIIIVYTNLASEIIEDCNRLGCAGYLTKPIRIEEVYDTLEKVFSPREKKRKYLRVSVNKKIDVIYKGREYSLYTANLSEGGIYIRKTNPFPIGSELEITMHLENEGYITVQGIVIHVTGLFGDILQSTPGMGVQFKELSDNQMLTLKRYKERLFAEDIFRGAFPKYC